MSMGGIIFIWKLLKTKDIWNYKNVKGHTETEADYCSGWLV